MSKAMSSRSCSGVVTGEYWFLQGGFLHSFELRNDDRLMVRQILIYRFTRLATVCNPPCHIYWTGDRNAYLNRSILAIQIPQAYGVNKFDATPMEEDAESAHVSSHIDQRFVGKQLDHVSNDRLLL